MVDLTVIGLTNLSLFIGFIYIAFALLPRFEIHNALVKLSGTAFFVMGAALRFPIVINAIMGEEANNSLTSGHLAVMQVVMAICVWIFIVGLHKQKISDKPVGFVTEKMSKLEGEISTMQNELHKKESELNAYQKERFTRSISEMQTRVEELKAIVKETEGRM